MTYFFKMTFYEEKLFTFQKNFKSHLEINKICYQETWGLCNFFYSAQNLLMLKTMNYLIFLKKNLWQPFINFQTDIDHLSFQVSLMHNVNGKNCFQWPSSEDKLMYPCEDILREIEPPTPIN